MKFRSKEEIEKWVNGQDWYQTIELSNGIVTPGKFNNRKRDRFFDDIDFRGKSFLDVGCNSGQYCLMAKTRGASHVVGIDINDKRLEQAKVLASIEKLDIEFKRKGIFEIKGLGKFDLVFCIAILTEIQDFFGSIEILKSLIGGHGFVELDLAKPVFYLSRSKTWKKGKRRGGIPRMKAVTEVRYVNGQVMMSPSIEVLSQAFGEEFQLQYLGNGPRYDMIKVAKISPCQYLSQNQSCLP